MPGLAGLSQDIWDRKKVTGPFNLNGVFAVPGRLGLELKKQEATVPVYIMERFERPAAAR